MCLLIQEKILKLKRQHKKAEKQMQQKSTNITNYISLNTRYPTPNTTVLPFFPYFFIFSYIKDNVFIIFETYIHVKNI